MRGIRSASVLGLALFTAFLPLALAAQAQQDPVPDSLKTQMLFVLFHAVIPQSSVGTQQPASPDPGTATPSPASAGPIDQGAERIAWEERGSKGTMVGTPTSFKLVASNAIVLFQVTPFEDKAGGITLVAQGQVWFRRSDGGLSYRTSLNTVRIKFDEVMLFYPLGMGPEGKAPLRLEISVSKTDPAAAGTGGK